MNRLRRLSPWLVFSPWMVVICAFVLAAYVVYVGVTNARREGEYVTRLMESRGAALIGTLEAALRTGMGFSWSDEEFQDILDRTGQQPDIRRMVIASPSGVVLASHDSGLTGSTVMPPEELSSLAPDATPRHVLRDGLFWVYRELAVPEFDERLRRYGHGRGMGRMGMGRMGMNRSAQPDNATSHHTPPRSMAVLALVAFDADPVLDAMKADKGHTSIIAAVLVFVGIVGALTFFLVQAYRESRRLVQETTAFSSHVVRTLPVGIIATDPAGVITSMNPEAERIAGLSRVGEPFAAVLPDVWAHVQPLLHTGQAVRDWEARCLVGDRRLPLALSASPIVTEDGQAVGNAFIVRDLGEIRRLQAELRHSERLAALGNMAAGIAHEIRNPLGAIKGLARFFEEASDAHSEEARVAAIMTREVARLDKVVGDLLDFARPDNLHREPVTLRALVERVQRLMQNDLDARHVTFTTDIPDPDHEVVVDADRIAQVLLNLCVNAVQAMADQKEGQTLTVGARKDGEWTVLDVRDTGPGMSAEVQAHMFSPYFTTKAQGTGLGLSIVHKIVEAHGGQVEVESTPGKGTVFSVKLPADLA